MLTYHTRSHSSANSKRAHHSILVDSMLLYVGIVAGKLTGYSVFNYITITIMYYFYRGTAHVQTGAVWKRERDRRQRLWGKERGYGEIMVSCKKRIEE